MKTDIVLSGVGGQGVLSMAAIIAEATRYEGLHVKQGEVHGMSQRGGSVRAFLRISDRPVQSDHIAVGTADMILSLEPVESLRYLPYLRPGGVLITSIDPVTNIPDYPARERVLAMLQKLPRMLVIEAAELARAAGLLLATNVVMVGAASHFLPIRVESIERCIREGLAFKGEAIVQANLRAFSAGREAVQCATTT